MLVSLAIINEGRLRIFGINNSLNSAGGHLRR
jgi:hypothetical protein